VSIEAAVPRWIKSRQGVDPMLFPGQEIGSVLDRFQNLERESGGSVLCPRTLQQLGVMSTVSELVSVNGPSAFDVPR
jgi:hypothetical protein